MILTKSDRKEFDVDFEINLKIKQHSLNSLLMVVPTNRRIRALKREMIAQSPGSATGRINLETIGSVSAKLLFNSSSVRTNMITDAAASVLLQQSFGEVKLNYFSKYNGEIPSGTLNRIRNVISEYKRHEITPGKIREEAEELTGSEKYKALDIADAYEEYQKKLNSSGLKEIGDIYSSLNKLEDDSFQNNFASLYPEVTLIIIMGFDEFTLPEINIINRLAGINKTELFLSFDYYKYNPLIFSHLDNCYKNFLADDFKEITDKSLPLYSRFQDEVRENLFFKKGDEKSRSYKDRITTLSGSTREKEIEFIASGIKEIIVNKKVRPDRICVVFNLISNYSDIIRDIFPLYGLPFNLTDRFHLSDASPVVSLMSFLEIAENDFYYKNIFRALSGGILEIEDVNLTNLLQASVRLKIISGFDNWQKTLNDSILSLEENEEESYDIDELKDSYKKALSDIDKIHDYLSPFLQKMSVPQFRENLYRLINELKLPGRLLSSNPDEAEKNIRSVNVFLETADEILALLEEQLGRKERFPVKFFLHNLRTAVSFSRYNIKEKPGYGVQITTMNEIRGLKFDYLFIAGLCDGDFPTKFSPEIFFSGTMARVKGEQNHITEERYLFYQSLCAWSEKLYLTFPRGEERKEFVQSGFMREFLETFEASPIEETNYKDKIYTREQLLTFIGRNGMEKAEALSGFSSAGLSKEEINHAMEIDRLRTETPFTESVYTGYVSGELSEEGKRNLEQMKNRQFSISQLETYALCPYRYFAERVLKLNIFEEPTEEIEALELGSLLHSILFTFYSSLKEQNVVLSKCTNKEFNAASKLMFRIAEEKVNEVNFNSPLSFFEREKIFGIEGDRKNSILYKFLIAERENKDGYIPEFFEAGFGRLKEERDQKIMIDELTAGEIKVRGKIDRIDINPDEKNYKVFDYKTGKSRLNKQDIITGLQLQLPLYLYAAKEIIKSELNESYKPAGAAIYSLKYNSDDFGRKELKLGSKTPDEEITEKYEELINICLDAVNKYVNGISNGDFRLTQLEKREEKACRFCGFKAICRIREVKE
jgi:ATP-dependent helicase/nuclease subunit B